MSGTSRGLARRSQKSRRPHWNFKSNDQAGRNARCRSRCARFLLEEPERCQVGIEAACIAILAGYKSVKRDGHPDDYFCQSFLRARFCRSVLSGLSPRPGADESFLAVRQLEKFDGNIPSVSRFPPIPQGLTKCSQTDRFSRRSSADLRDRVIVGIQGDRLRLV